MFEQGPIRSLWQGLSRSPSAPPAQDPPQAPPAQGPVNEYSAKEDSLIRKSTSSQDNQSKKDAEGCL